MKKAPLLLAVASALGVNAQAEEASRHHFGASIPVWLNAHAKFTATRVTNPGPAAGSAVERFYDDGYNRVDSTGNAVAPPPPAAFSMPRTSFFGYQADGQVVNSAAPPNGGTLSLHSAQLNGGDYTGNLDNKPFPGLEFFYRYDWKKGKEWSLGLEAGAAYNYFKWERSGAPNSTVDLITDVFALGGVTLPAGAPYNGLFANLVPGIPVVGSTPVRTQGTVAAAVAGKRQLEMHALQLRVGPVLNWEPDAKWQVGVQGGLALGVGFSQLSFAEQITVANPSVPVISQSGQSSDAHFWSGLFSSVRVSRQFGEHWRAHVEVRHLLTDKLQHVGPTRSAEINLTDGFGVAAGLSYAF